MMEYSVDLCILAVETGWNSESLQAGFVNGLSELVKDELVILDH